MSPERSEATPLPPPPRARAWTELDLSAVRENAATLRRLAGVPLLAVVKANGYGHGAGSVARAALEGGADGLGVATADEAAALRAAGIHAPIQVLGSFLPDELDLAVEARAELTLHALDDVERVRQAALRAGRPLPIHLKVDVGMARHGVPVERAFEALEAAQRDPGLRVVGLMTHFPSACASDLELTRAQTAAFARLVERARRAGILPERVHAAASAALLRVPEARFSGVRSGIALLGVDPAECIEEPLRAADARLLPALSVRVRVMRTKDVPAGAPVGYSGRWVAPRPSRIALLGAGYADGLPFGLGGRGAAVLLQGRRCPIVGSVMMDYTAIDVTDLPRPPQPGDVATVVGQDGSERIQLEEQARRAGLIPYAVSCGLGARLARVEHDAAASAATPRLLRAA